MISALLQETAGTWSNMAYASTGYCCGCCCALVCECYARRQDWAQVQGAALTGLQDRRAHLQCCAPCLLSQRHHHVQHAQQKATLRRQSSMSIIAI